MPNPPAKEEYSDSFPSSWTTVSSPKNTPASQQPTSSQDLPTGSGEGFRSITPSSQHRTEKIVSRDFAYHAFPTIPKPTEFKKPSPANSLKVPTRKPSPKPDPIPLEVDDMYSTVYPSSWTISTNLSSATPAIPSRLVSTPAIASATAIASRTASTTSQGEVTPISPVQRRNRLQRDFWSVHVPSKKDKVVVKQRALSTLGSTMQKPPLKNYPQTIPLPRFEVTAPRHESQTSTYSTLE